MKLSKSIITSVLCASMLMLCGCVGGKAPIENPPTVNTDPVDPNGPLVKGKTLKLLAITSSFGLNTTELLYDIAKAEGYTEVIIGRLYASGCTLETHATWAKDDTAGYQYTKFSDKGRETFENYSLRFGLQDEDWDIIFTQQSAASSGLIDSYCDYIDVLMSYIHKYKTNPDARFVWNMTWAYQKDSQEWVFKNVFNYDQDLMYKTIVDVVQQLIVPRDDFDRIIPSGTAIQNARTSFIGDTLTKDTFHLNNLGRVIAGYTLFSVLTGQELTEINLGPVNTVDLREYLDLTEAQRKVVIESVNNAIKNPWEVTPSVYTEE